MKCQMFAIQFNLYDPGLSRKITWMFAHGLWQTAVKVNAPCGFVGQTSESYRECNTLCRSGSSPHTALFHCHFSTAHHYACQSEWLWSRVTGVPMQDLHRSTSNQYVVFADFVRALTRLAQVARQSSGGLQQSTMLPGDLRQVVILL